jgi:hypothetical protein
MATVVKASTEKEVETALHSKFLRYSIYRDLQLWLVHLPDSFHVGPGALETLQSCTKTSATASPEEKLKELHEWLKPQLPTGLVKCVVDGPLRTRNIVCVSSESTRVAFVMRAGPEGIVGGRAGGR